MKSFKNQLVLTGLAVAFGILAACSNSSDMTNGGKGAVQFRMSAAPASTSPTLAATTTDGSTGDHVLQAANVTFASIEARNLDGQLIDVTIALPVTVDLFTLIDGGAVTLPVGFLPPGTYDQLVIVMTKVELTLANGTIITIEPPGGGWTAIVRVTEPFTVADGSTTTVNIRFRGAFRWLTDHWDFHPDFDCDGGHDEDDD
jgi:hypothetical protein